MKKWIVWCSFFLLGCTFLFGSLYVYVLKEEKYSCRYADDCVLSLTDPEDFQICVNSGYYVNAKKGFYQRVADSSLSCNCIKNRCVRSDQGVGCH